MYKIKGKKSYERFNQKRECIWHNSTSLCDKNSLLTRRPRAIRRSWSTSKRFWGRMRKPSRKRSRRKNSFLTQPTLAPKSIACGSASVRWRGRCPAQAWCHCPTKWQGSTKPLWKPVPKTEATENPSPIPRETENLFAIKGSPLHKCVKAHGETGGVGLQPSCPVNTLCHQGNKCFRI